MDFLSLAKARYSVRKLADRPVEQEKLDKILAAAMAAPTATNSQPIKIWVMQSPEALEKVRQTNSFPFVQAAPVVFVVGGDPKTAWKRPFDGHSFAEVDASIVATHIMLAVQDQGLGTTWVGYFDPDKMKALFPEMEGYELVALFAVGYPAEDSAPSERHALSRPADELIRVL